MRLLLGLLLLHSVVVGYNSFHIDIVRYQSSKGLLKNVSGCDFRGAGSLLQGVNFANVQMSGVLFCPCKKQSDVAGVECTPNQVTDLTGINFSGATLVNANFIDAILKGTDFSGADIMYANFSGADLTGAKLDDAVNATTAIFCNATMPNGSQCSQKSWTSKSGKVFLCHCPKKSQS